VFAFLPLPVLSLVNGINEINTLKSCGRALLMLAKAIDSFQNEGNFKTGKAWEKVIESVLLLHARSNKRFSPSVFCRRDTCGKDVASTVLLGGVSVESWDDIDSFPKRSYPTEDQKVLGDEVAVLINRLRENYSCGVVFILDDNFNLKGDVIGIFQTTDGNYVALIIQAKDWFQGISFNRDRNAHVSMMEEWKKFDPFPRPLSVKLKNGEIVTVTPIHLLLQTNEFEEDEYQRQLKRYPLKDSDGIGSIKEMLTYLSTAGFACQLAEKLREIFPYYDMGAVSSPNDPY
jgi:hypothetical protein